MLKMARLIADYQFGRGAGDAIFFEGTSFQLSSTKRLRYLFDGKDRLATLRASDGMLTLSLIGASRLHAYLPSPGMRVISCDDAVPFVRKGGNLFARHVVGVDAEIRAGDEVLVVDGDDNLIATGKAVLSPEEMLQINRGQAVSVRYGVDD